MTRRLIIRFPLTAMVSAMIIWALHLVLMYSAVGLACERPDLLAHRPLWWLLLLSTVLALAVVAIVGSVGWRLWRQSAQPDGTARRRRFMGRLAATLAALAAVAIMMAALPVFLLPPCLGWGSLT